jgi:hypothetical protein
MTRRKILAIYNVYAEFIVPKNVPLLSTRDNARGLPFSWCVKWNTLYYQDEDGNEKEIKERYELQPDFKYPNEYESDDTDDEEDSDEGENESE